MNHIFIKQPFFFGFPQKNWRSDRNPSWKSRIIRGIDGFISSEIFPHPVVEISAQNTTLNRCIIAQRVRIRLIGYFSANICYFGLSDWLLLLCCCCTVDNCTNGMTEVNNKSEIFNWLYLVIMVSIFPWPVPAVLRRQTDSQPHLLYTTIEDSLQPRVWLFNRFINRWIESRRRSSLVSICDGCFCMQWAFVKLIRANVIRFIIVFILINKFP